MATMSVSELDLPIQAGTTMKSGRLRTMAMRASAAGANVEGGDASLVLDHLFDPEDVRQLQQ
jgi:hypothetical protein